MAKTNLTGQAEQKRWRVSLSTKAAGESIGTFTCPADDLFEAAKKATELYPACEVQSVVLQETPEQELAATKAAIEWARGSARLLENPSIDVGTLWAEGDSASARAAGWDLSRRGDSWRVMRDGGDPIFRSDSDLASHLQLMADIGGELEKRAIHAVTASNSPDAALFSRDRAEPAQSVAAASDGTTGQDQPEAVTVRRMRSPHGWSVDIKSSARDMFVSTTEGTSQELRDIAAEMERDAQRRLKRAAFILAGADALQKVEAQAEKLPTPGV